MLLRLIEKAFLALASFKWTQVDVKMAFQLVALLWNVPPYYEAAVRI